MSFYTGLKATATKLLTDKGQLVTITRKTAAGFDVGSGFETAPSTTSFTGYGAVFNYNDNKVNGTLIQVGDIRFLFQATDTAPLVDDTTVIDGDTYTVMSVKKTSPAGTVVMYELQLRK